MSAKLSYGPRFAKSRPRVDDRRGISTIWAIIAIPAVLTLVGVVMETAHLWMARLELQAALESGALAGVKRWADVSTQNGHATPGAIATTDSARVAAQAAAGANTVSGQSVLLNLNELNDSNDQTGFDNASCTGDVLLGGMSSTTFSATAGVGCGRTTSTSFTVTYNITVDTGSGDTSNVPNAFTIGFTSPDSVSLSQVQIDLQNGGVGVGVFQPGIPLDQVAFTGNEALGNGPTVDGSSDISRSDVSFLFNATNSVMTINVTPGVWISGLNLVFGVDTDGVRVNGGTVTATDQGGDFGASGGASSTSAGAVLFSFGFNGGTPIGLEKTLQANGNKQSNLQGNPVTISNTITVPNVDFAVLTQKTVTVKPIFGQIFGNVVGNYQVSGRAIATARCVGSTSTLVQNPQAVYVTGFSCP